jgi:hypothetical protein
MCAGHLIGLPACAIPWINAGGTPAAGMARPLLGQNRAVRRRALLIQSEFLRLS